MMYIYKLGSEKGEGWGKFVIDESGYFSVVSDYGNYAFQWSAMGEGVDVRDFLSGLDSDYLMGKLGRRNWFDSVATHKKIKRLIIEMRKDNNATKEKAREAWRDIPEQYEFENTYREYLEEHWSFFQDLCGIMDYDFPPDLRAFAKKLYPRFVDSMQFDKAIEKEGPL